MTKFQAFYCSSIDGLGEGAYSVLSVFVVRMTGKENIYKAEAWEVRRPTPHQVEQKCQEATQWVTNLWSWFSSCLLIRPLRIRTVLHMLSFLRILTGIFLTIGQTVYLFHFWCERGLIDDSAPLPGPLRGSCSEVLYRWGWQAGLKEGSKSGSLAILGEHKGVIWNYESVQTLAWILQEPKTHQAGSQLLSFLLRC